MRVPKKRQLFFSLIRFLQDAPSHQEIIPRPWCQRIQKVKNRKANARCSARRLGLSCPGKQQLPDKDIFGPWEGLAWIEGREKIIEFLANEGQLPIRAAYRSTVAYGTLRPTVWTLVGELGKEVACPLLQAGAIFESNDRVAQRSLAEVDRGLAWRSSGEARRTRRAISW